MALTQLPAHRAGARSGSIKNDGLRIRRFAVRCQAAQRAVVVLPGLGNNSADYDALKAALQQDYGLCVEVAPVKRIDWARNAAGLVDPNYWKGTLNPRPTVDWYLERTAAAVAAARAAAPGAPITLLAHSAGGWLGRLFLLDQGTAGIDQFVSLGSPHQPPPPGVIDQTRGILSWVSAACPGAHHAGDGVQYVTIAGRYIRGAPLLGPGPWARRIVGAGYQQVCGEAEVWGDGVVPLPSAHLEGALQLTLDGVYHSPLGAVGGEPGSPASLASDAASSSAVVYDSDEYQVSPAAAAAAAADAAPGPRRWYGSPGVLERWVDILTDPAAAQGMVAAAQAKVAAKG